MMDISISVVKIAFLALPGLLASKIYRKLRGKTVKKNWEDFTEVLLFSLASYLVLAIFNGQLTTNQPSVDRRSLVGQPCSSPSTQNASSQVNAKVSPSLAAQNKPVETTSQTNAPQGVLNTNSVLNSLSDEKKAITLTSEIGWACLIAVALAAIASCQHSNKWISRFSRLLHMSKRIGDEDIWEYFHESDKIVWVFVRDHKLNLIYYGAVAQYSDSERERELIIQDVSVYTADTEHLYDTPALYVCRDKYDLSLELPPAQKATTQPTKEIGHVRKNTATAASST